jgi:GAF domain-containing protein
MRVLEVFEEQSDEGPCPDCFRTGEPVANESLRTDGRWPRFAPKAIAAGFLAVQALPMRLRGLTIGALNMFLPEEGAMREADVVAAQAFADIATIAILQHRANEQSQRLNEQLSHALNTRVAIEQAKGIISERAGLDMEQSFARLRSYTRSHNLLLADVAAQIVNRGLRVEQLV